MSRSSHFKTFWIIIGLSLIALVIDLPKSFPINIHWKNINWDYTFNRPSLDFNLGSFHLQKTFDLKYGLDLVGGAELTFEADTSNIAKEDIADSLQSLKDNIERRVNLFGISEANVQLSTENGAHRLKVELPGVENVNQAISLIGQTAQLSFRGEVDLPPEATSTATIYDLFAKDTGLTGKNLVKSSVTFNQNNSEPEVSLTFDSEGSKLFEDATRQLKGKRIAIFLDDFIVSAPTVNDVITGGSAVINGGFDIKTARELSAQLNAGALPVPIKLIRQSTVGATLGQDSINKGVFAGLVGLALVALFMLGNYGALGLLANLALIIYGLLTLAIYKLIPITLTFPGIVGFILSIGMAVDSNILIFERIKEELRAGKPWNTAMELGFGRAWDSIKDANTCTIITALILFNPLNWSFLNSSGMIRGFAVTLLLGIVISIFTGVYVSRNLIRVFTYKKVNNSLKN